MSEDRLWATGEAYEPYVGRWSRLVAPEFVRWLSPASGGDWVDVGSGTGELTAGIRAHADPRTVRGVEPSEGFVAYARKRFDDPKVSFAPGNAQALPVESDSADFIVSGLVLNFVDDPAAAIVEFMRVARPGGTIAAYVWDYAAKMEMMRYFWDTAAELDPAARQLDEANRFTMCSGEGLRDLFTAAGLQNIETRSIDVPTVFADFDDYWNPFLGGQAPAPRYAMSLDEQRRIALRDLIHERLPVASDGSISLIARAWAVKAHRPTNP